MSWLITPTQLLVDDQDALTYLAAVEAADGQALESGVRLAVNAFVKGCKADGIWPAIKASCILAGARTRLGALTPLVGTAPTSFNFVDGDYNRKTGLVGNGSTKYLDSNRNNNADPLNSQHLSIFASTYAGSYEDSLITGSIDTGLGRSFIVLTSASTVSVANRSGNVNISVPSLITGLTGLNRGSAGSFTLRHGSTNYTSSTSSNSISLTNILLYRRPSALTFSASRLAFYSIGESLDLTLLDARVTTLINAFSAAIP